MSVAAGQAVPRLDAGPFLDGLVRRGDLSAVDAQLAGEVARQRGGSVVRAVVELGLLSEDDLADRLAEACGCDRLRAEDLARASVSEALPIAFMRASRLAALAGEGDGGVTQAIADPSDRRSLLAAAAQAGAPARVAVATQRDIEAFLRAARDDAGAGAPGGGAEADDRVDVATEIAQLRDMASEAPVVRFFNQTIDRAMEMGASDVHLERFDRRLSLRLRVDGMLVDQPPPPASLYDALLCRLKIMAGLDIAERRRAQDGRIRMRLRGRVVDLRVSLVPTLYGQDAVLRVQDRARLGSVTLEGIGFAPDQTRWLASVARKSHGMLLITGPTGSGKTTTLYALLRTLVTADRKIITVEDPVEYAMDGVNQIQVNPAIGVTFAGALRNVLRHDPDVVLVGEIRDTETAAMAFQAALTGHLVLSTLHTNDAPGTFVRLIDMGVEPYLVNAVIEGVTAQRLVRAVCRACRNDAAQRESCAACRGLGYRGRTAVMEHTRLPASVKRAVVEGADERRLRELLLADGYRPLRDRAAELVRAGVTDEAEVARVLGAADEAADAADMAP
ncbi:MAG: type II/IV secretion system protein [Planctomycetota bacterium]|nr:MAG: type II/IV secretion system protein [Planctomycetota bacterium]